MMNWPQLLDPSRKPGEKTDHQSFSARSAFEIDYDRIIFSHPFRKMQDKTQVVPLPEEDFVHTRLTHSLEVSSVARSLGKMSGEKILEKHPELKESFTPFDFGAICAAAALAHDIGNPPFGHSGETAISQFFEKHPKGQRFNGKVSEEEWADLISFEGNAQGFRLLNKEGQSALRLTFAVLAAFTKYPRAAASPKPGEKRRSQKKYGFYASEKSTYAQIASQVGLQSLAQNAWIRHPLAFLVEAADDICYLIIDLEDGCRLGLVSFGQVEQLLAKIIKDRYQPEKLAQITSLNEKLGVLRALTINKLIQECVEVFVANEAAIRNGSFDQSLTDEMPSAAVLEEISLLSVAQIYKSKAVVEREITGFKVLEGLLEVLSEVVWQQYETGNLGQREHLLVVSLPDGIGKRIVEAHTWYASLREMLDFVSGLTDRHAVKLYKKWFGI